MWPTKRFFQPSVAWLYVAAFVLCSSRASAQQFRLENQVFVGREKTSSLQSTTIFNDGLVYDFLHNPEEIVIFDRNRGRFVLLCPELKIRSELTTSQVEEFAKWVKNWALQQEDEVLKFFAEPQFQVSQEGDKLVFRSEVVIYEVVPQRPEDAAIVKAYQEFAVWYAKLNTLLNPGSKPPQGRVFVDQMLAQRGFIPGEVKLSIRQKDSLLPRWTQLRSVHKLVPYLVESDRKRIEQANAYLGTFTRLEFEQYQHRMKRQ